MHSHHLSQPPLLHSVVRHHRQNRYLERTISRSLVCKTALPVACQLASGQSLLSAQFPGTQVSRSRMSHETIISPLYSRRESFGFRILMATSSSSSSSSMSRRNYGVFLSFRGPDVRNTFMSRLYEKLCDKGVYTFKDSPELEQGDRRGELFDAIEGSRIAVITFSENYARSKWCLNELAKIMELEKQGKIVVLPIFYKVSPGEVRLHEKEKGVKGCYQLAMEDMEVQHGMEMANIWRKALWEGGDLIGESVEEG